MIDDAANEMKAVALESIERQLYQIGDGDNREIIIAAVRKVVLEDVDSRVKEKAEELWLKGKSMLSTIQTKHKEKTQALADDLGECLKKQQLLEDENANLKQALQSLASRFQMLGSLFNATPKVVAEHGGMVDTSNAASTVSPNQNNTVSEFISPAALISTPETAKVGELGAIKFPDIPAFPSPSPVAQLSLAEALQQSPQPATQTPGSSSASADLASTGPENSSNTHTFSFTLRKADGADLGLNVSHHESDRVLRVEGVRAEGAVEAWNRQCASSIFAEKAVLPGDIITNVNGIMLDPKKMLEECRDKQLLKLTIVRNLAPSKPSTQLRANAIEFVPGQEQLRADAAEFVPGVPVALSASQDEEQAAAEERVPDATDDGHKP
jgi:hypothetical protein